MQVSSFDQFLQDHPIFRHEEAERFLVATGLCKEGRPVQTYLVNRTVTQKNPDGVLKRVRRGLYAAAKAPPGATPWPDPLLVAWRAYSPIPGIPSDPSNGIVAFQAALHFWASRC